MGRTALYRDPMPFSTVHAEVQLDADVVIVRMPDGRIRKLSLDGVVPMTIDGFALAHVDVHDQRRFVRMLVLEREASREVMITPPELADWVIGGGRLAACAIAELARLAMIATPQFAVLLGEVAAQRALEVAWVGRGPLRGGTDVDTALQPLVEAARQSPRAAEALVSALAHAAGATRRRRRFW
jgi:hypothetical protein